MDREWHGTFSWDCATKTNTHSERDARIVYTLYSTYIQCTCTMYTHTYTCINGGGGISAEVEQIVPTITHSHTHLQSLCVCVFHFPKVFYANRCDCDARIRKAIIQTNTEKPPAPRHSVIKKSRETTRNGNGNGTGVSVWVHGRPLIK